MSNPEIMPPVTRYQIRDASGKAKALVGFCLYFLTPLIKMTPDEAWIGWQDSGRKIVEELLIALEQSAHIRTMYSHEDPLKDLLERFLKSENGEQVQNMVISVFGRNPDLI